MHDVLTLERQLTGLDHARLRSLLRTQQEGAPLSPLLAAVRDWLDSVEIVDSAAIPGDTVTMRSRVALWRDGASPMIVELCYPHEADIARSRISVISPLGMALLGARVGEHVHWTAPDGDPREARVAALLYQPEAAGHHEL